MRFHIGETLTRVDYLIPLARLAEEAGYAGVAIPDSILFPEVADTKYSYSGDGDRSFIGNNPVVETFVLAGAVAAATSRIEITTSVVKLPVRQPVYAAKLASSVAALSNNRFLFGVGLSVWPEDYAAVQIPYERRGQRFDECLEILEGLMTGQFFEYHGEFYDFPSIKLNPVPTKPMPILIGGHSEAALKRAARYDGWISASGADADMRRYVATIERHRAELGKTGPYRIFETDISMVTLDDVKRKRDAGVTDLILFLRNIYAGPTDVEPLSAKVGRFKRFADEVMGHADD